MHAIRCADDVAHLAELSVAEAQQQQQQQQAAAAAAAASNTSHT
jgi:hypothetical protein